MPSKEQIIDWDCFIKTKRSGYGYFLTSQLSLNDDALEKRWVLAEPLEKGDEGFGLYTHRVYITFKGLWAVFLYEKGLL